VRGLQERRSVPALTDGRPEGRSRARLLVVTAVAGAVIAADQVTKSAAQTHLGHGVRHVLGPLDLELTYNTGAAFGLGRGWAPLLVFVGLALVGVVFGMSRAARSWPAVVASALVLGGALSNLGDRLIRHNGGAVIDFIRLPHWPTFNVADSSIVVGVVLLVAGSLLPSRA